MSFRNIGGFNNPYYNSIVNSTLPITYYDIYQLWGWGTQTNSQTYVNGALGLSDIVNRSSPVQIASTIPWTSSIHTDGYSVAAIKSDGTLWMWGLNATGTLGQNDIIERSSPIQVGTLTNWLNSKIWISNTTNNPVNRIHIIKPDKTLWTWGDNAYGQLGFNDTISRSSPVQLGGINYPWSAVDSGKYVTTAIKSDGTLWTWGDNTYGTLGDGTAISKSSPIQVGTLTNWSKISNTLFSLAIKTDGTLWAWGNNQYGQLGQNDVISKSSPVQVGLLTTWLSISAGKYNTSGLKTDGTLWTWGRGLFGPLGQNDVVNRSSPTQVGTDTNWASIDNSISNYVLATKTDGTLWTWGYNSYGELGLGDIVYRSSPVQIGSLTNWLKISAGYYTALSIKTDGTLWAWGYNAYGQLGQNFVQNRSSPIQIGTATNWSKIAGNRYFVSAIKTDGTLWAWGINANGELGDNTVVPKSSPNQVGRYGLTWSSITSNGTGSTKLAILSNGTLWGWGTNTNGELGQNDITNRSSPTQIGVLNTWASVSSAGQASFAIKTDGTLWAWGGNTSYGALGLNDLISKSSPIQVGGLTNWSKISSSNIHALAIKTDGTLWGWGQTPANGTGITAAHLSSPVQIGALTTWSSIAATSNSASSAAIKTDGTLWVWGNNSQGQLGLNDATSRSTPVQLGAATVATGAIQIASSYNNGTMAIVKPDKTLWTWGYNTQGQLGSGTVINRSSPVQVGTAVWESVVTGVFHLAAIRTDGTLWTWGGNQWGQLGSGTVINRSSPVQVGTDTTWSKISASHHTLAIKTDGTLWTWGFNRFEWGNLGLNDTAINRSSPVQVGALTNWLSIAAGYYTSVAIKTDGTLWTWGKNQFGALGDNTVVPKSSPIQVGTDTNWSSVSIGDCIFAFKTDGTLWSWGNNQFGQLGLGNAVVHRSSPTQVGTDTNWSSISANYTTLSVKTDGTLWSWGFNGLGGLGNGIVALYRSSPVQVGALTNWLAAASSYSASFGFKQDGSLWSWGNGISGVSGYGTILSKSSPVQVGLLVDWPSRSYALQTTPQSTWSKVAVDLYNMIAIRTDGTLWVWGSNNNGQLGNGLAGVGLAKSSPIQVGALTNWLSVSSGGYTHLLTKTDGTTWAFGNNATYQFGDGVPNTSRSSPVQVGTNVNIWSSLAITSRSVNGIKTDGTLWSWGDNATGQHGKNDNNNRWIPTQVGIKESIAWANLVKAHHGVSALRTDNNLYVVGLNTTGSLGQKDVISRSSPVQTGDYANWSSISGFVHTIGIKDNGTLWAWGYNINGRLGDNTIVYRSSPVQIGTDTNWLSATTGTHTLALKTDGTLWAWGQNNFGSFGDGTTISTSSPVQVGSAVGFLQSGGLNNWSKIPNSSMNYYVSYAIKNDGTLWAWGENTTYGAIGDGTAISRSSPVQIGALTTWNKIANGAAIKTDGTLWTWGRNNGGSIETNYPGGHLGLGDVITRSSPVQVGTGSTWSSVIIGLRISIATIF